MEKILARKIQKINESFSTNEILTAITILSILKNCNSLDLTKILLIEPLCSYKKLLKKFTNKKIQIRSIEELIIKSDFILTNFNKKYKECMIVSLNSIYLLLQLKLVNIIENKIFYNGDAFDFKEKTLGEKAKIRINASSKLSNILKCTQSAELYLHLRVEL